MKTLLLLAAALGIATGSASAAEYDCPVDLKLDSERVYTPEHLAKWQFSVRIVDDGERAQLSPCGFSSSAGTVTCEGRVIFVDGERCTARATMDHH